MWKQLITFQQINPQEKEKNTHINKLGIIYL